jgi:hypothetical protein
MAFLPSQEKMDGGFGGPDLMVVRDIFINGS